MTFNARQVCISFGFPLFVHKYNDRLIGLNRSVIYVGFLNVTTVHSFVLAFNLEDCCCWAKDNSIFASFLKNMERIYI